MRMRCAQIQLLMCPAVLKCASAMCPAILTDQHNSIGVYSRMDCACEFAWYAVRLSNLNGEHLQKCIFL